MGGLKDAGKIVGAGLAEMFGDKTQISTINAANMLSYTGDANLGIAKDIWDENINVEYRELTDDNGLYTHSTNTITLSSSLIGGGKEESAKLATVMAHEGSHANGVNVEALAHANGLQTYSAINTMFGLNGDKNFSNQMLAGIMAPENWKENTGDVEHWAFKLNGTIIDDGKNYFTREVILENGVSFFEKIEGSDFTGSKAKALAEAIGIENVEKMLDKSITSLKDIPQDVLDSVLGGRIGLEHIPESVQNVIFNAKKSNLIGEYLLMSNGSTWNGNIKQWEGGNVVIPGLGVNDSLGVIRNSETGKYTFFTAGMNFTREDDAFSAYSGNKDRKDVSYEQRDNTDVSFWMKDLFTGNNIAQETFNNAFTSIDNENYSNSIVSEYFNMRLINYNLEKYGVNQVGLFSNAQTAAGNTIGINGYDGVTSGRYLYHPTDQWGTMEGCIGPMSDNNVVNYNSLKPEHNINGHTGAYYYQQQLNLYNSLGIYNGYQFNVHLKGKVHP